MATTGIILTGISLQDNGNVSYNTSQRFVVTGTGVKNATTLAMTASLWAQIPTGSFGLGNQYVNVGNITSGSLIDIAANGTGSTNIFARMKYLDGITLPPSASQTYWGKPVSQGPFTGSSATGSLFVVSVEN